MPIEPEKLAWRYLRAEEAAELPSSVKTRFEGVSDPRGEWILLHAADRELGLAVGRAIRVLGLKLAAGGDKGRDSTWDQLLDQLVECAPRGIETDLWIDNLELRMNYLRDTPTLSAAEVHEASGLSSRNISEPASRWKREGKIFSIRHGRADRYPAFQFLDGAPRPVVKSILAALPDSMTGWQTALWFASGNGWLDGDEPQHRLDDGDLVVGAACHLSEPAHG